MEMCRACLSTGEDLVPMDEAFVNNYNLLTNLNLILNEVPLYTCNVCFDAATFCIEFREKCISSDLTLKEILFPSCQSNVNKDAKVLEIKEELKLDYESDSITGEDFYNEPFDDYNMIKIKKDEDWAPKKTLKHTEVKKAMRPKRKNIPKETQKNCDITIALHCGICSKSFDERGDLVSHLEHHEGDNTCGLCVEQFIDFTHLLAHRLMHLPRKQKVCYLCPRKFITAGPDIIEFHYVKQHKLRGDNGRLLCKLCVSPFDCPKNLRNHIRTVHSDIKYTCDECGKGFRIKRALRLHINSHRDKKSYECDICDYTSKFATGVRTHKLSKHTTGRVYCKSCGQVFRNQETLEKHSCKHLLGAICPVCGKYITKPTKLSRHMKSHSETRRYECVLCPSKFKSPGAFQAHNNRHAGTRPFRCDHCPMRFYSHPPLIKHRRTHTGEKPYVCKICQKGFTGNYNLKVHMKVHGINNLIMKKSTEPEVNIFE